MSTKRFCDGPCGKEITESKVTPTDWFDVGTVKVGVTVGSHGDICVYCLIDALVKLDDRPKPPMRVDFYPPPACDHAELVRLVKAWLAGYSSPVDGDFAVDSRMALADYARTLP